MLFTDTFKIIKCDIQHTSLVVSPANAGDLHKRCGFSHLVVKMSWRRKWQPTPVFLPGESRGHRSLEGYSPWGRKELDTTE